MPYVSFEGEGWQRTLESILAGVFWFGFIMGFVSLRPIDKKRKAENEDIEKSGVTFFQFFANKPAIIFDVLLILCLIITAVSTAVPTLPQILSFGGMFGLVFSLEMHGIFNGRNFKYLSKQKNSFM